MKTRKTTNGIKIDDWGKNEIYRHTNCNTEQRIFETVPITSVKEASTATEYQMSSGYNSINSWCNTAISYGATPRIHWIKKKSNYTIQYV